MIFRVGVGHRNCTHVDAILMQLGILGAPNLASYPCTAAGFWGPSGMVRLLLRRTSQ